MATLTAALAAIERHIGIPKSRSQSVARRLQEANLLPFGAPGVAPEINEAEFATLLIALGADRTLRTAAETVREFVDLQPGGCSDVQGGHNAFTEICIAVDLALHAPENVRGVQYEFCHSWPEFVIHENGKAKRFVAPGANPNRWQANGHRTSTTINGAGLADAAIALFGKK